MDSLPRLCIFDFDGTICSFDTADAFVFFAIEGRSTAGIRAKNAIRKIWLRGLSRFFGSNARSSVNKRLVLWQLRGMEESLLEEKALAFWNERIRPRLRPEALALIERRRSEGCRLWLVSASYDIYLKHVAATLSFDRMVSTRIGFAGGVCKGIIDGRDVRGSEKIRRVSAIGESAFLRPVEAVSDSASDIPILTWADSAVVVFKSPAVPDFSSKIKCSLLPCKT